MFGPLIAMRLAIATQPTASLNHGSGDGLFQGSSARHTAARVIGFAATSSGAVPHGCSAVRPNRDAFAANLESFAPRYGYRAHAASQATRPLARPSPGAS